VSPNPKTFLRAALFASVAVLAACASTTPRAEPDDMCRQIADFANASDDGSPHEVRLITDWGGTSCSTPTEVALACKACSHDAYPPGKQLCAYLMEHTATEFSQMNLARALSCLNLGYTHLELGPRLDALANRRIQSAHADQVKRGISVSVEYQLPTEGDSLPTLILQAQRDRTP
jgi:hypothetical protein